MEQTIDSILLFVPFDWMLHRQLTSRFKEVRHLRWVGISPFKAFQSFNMSGSSVQTRFSQACTAKRPFCHCTCLPVPASVGGAQSRCTRTDYAEQVVSHRVLFERSIERFRVGIRALEDLSGNRRAGWLYHPIELWVLVGACLGSAAPWKSSEFDKKPGACGAYAILCCPHEWLLIASRPGQGLLGPAKQNPFRSRLPLASAGAWNWLFSGAVRAAWIGLVFLSMALRLSRWAAVLLELPRRRQETWNSSQVRDVPAWQWWAWFKLQNNTRIHVKM